MKEYKQSKFKLATDKDKEYQLAKVKYAKELDERSDAMSAAANLGQMLVESGKGLYQGFEDLFDFGLKIAGFDDSLAISQKLRMEIRKDSSDVIVCPSCGAVNSALTNVCAECGSVL